MAAPTIVGQAIHHLAQGGQELVAVIIIDQYIVSLIGQ
jgi:hypothetical protein